MSAFLPTTATMKPEICIYLFHGKAARTIVLAIIADMQTAKERKVGDMLRVKAAAEALHQPQSLQDSEKSILDPLGLMWVIGTTYLTILADFSWKASNCCMRLYPAV